MRNHLKKIFFISASFIILLVGFWFFRDIANAQTIDLGLKPVAATGLPTTDIRTIIANIIKVALGLLGIVAVGLMLYAGFEWMTAGGNEEQIGTAKKIMVNAAIGLAIILSAYTIVSFVMNKLLEATGGITSDQKCQAQIKAGGKNCDGDCPACPPCPPGEDCSVKAPFYLKQKPVGGNVCIRNYHPVFIFSKAVDLATLSGHIVIVDALSTSTVVVGTWQAVANNPQAAAFYVNGGCGNLSANDCFPKDSKFQIQFKQADKILSSDGQSLQCGFGGANCNSIDFTTGANVDQQAPKIKILLPVSGDAFGLGNLVPVKVHYDDDGGLQNLLLNVDNNFFASAPSSIASCATSSDVTINWQTNNFKLGNHNVETVGLDWSAKSGKDNITVNLKPAHCFNNKLDQDLGEKFTSASGDCGGECGACANDKCYKDSDCASGFCQTKDNKPKDGTNEGICVDKTRIDDFSPYDGAPGDYVSVFGKYFGTTTGKVYLSSPKNNEWIEAPVVNCGAGFKNWTDNQIIVSVPVGTAVSGPLKLVTALGGVNGTDITTDNWGPKPGGDNGNFKISNVAHPGICLVNPNHGTTGINVILAGKGFGLQNVGGQDFVRFQEVKSAIVNWAESAINTIVPSGLANGDFPIQVVKNNVVSNGVKFQVEGSNTSDPIISSLSASNVVYKDYLTIYGKNFGTAGNVIFKLNGIDQSYIGETSFPAQCSGFWKDNQVIIKIPANTGLGSFSVQIERKNPNNAISQIDKNFFVNINAGSPAPGICGIDPASAPIPFAKDQVVTIYGDNFDLDKNDNVYFWKAGGEPFNSDKLSVAAVKSVDAKGQVLTTIPSNDVVSGDVYVMDLASKKKSNTIKFSAFDCAKNNNTCSDAETKCCAAGVQSGMCVPKDKICVGEKKSSGYSWLFATGGIVSVPQVVERCNAGTDNGDNLPSPAPSIIWNKDGNSDANQVCQTALVNLEFSALIDQNSVNANSVKVFTCDLVNGNNCKNAKPINNLLAPSSFVLQNNKSLNISLLNNQKWSPNTWYQVALQNTIKSVVLKDKLSNPIQFNLAATRPCDNGNAYCFVFKVGEGDCKMSKVIINPNKFWTNVLEAPIKYRTAGGDAYDLTYIGNGLSTQHCILMNVSAFAWDWAPKETDYVKRLNMFGDNNRFSQFGAKANTVGIGLPSDSVTISATASADKNSYTGNSALTIDLSNPKVVDYAPKCLEACTNAEVLARFNVSLSDKNISPNATALSFSKCLDENCLALVKVNNIKPKVDSLQIGDRTVLRIYNTDPEQTLDPNSQYLVVLSVTSTPDKNSPNQIWSLAKANDPLSFSKPFNEKFTWRFRTKKEACLIDKVQVTPQLFDAQKLDDRAVFSAGAYSSPDSCSISGQKLNPWKYNWAWSSSDLAVAKLQDFKVLGFSPYCSVNCVLKGSDLPSGDNELYPVCGNGKMEAGEDCDPPSKDKNCSLNCLLINKTKKGSKPTAEAKDINASICGNGLLGVDEDCDLGIASNFSSPTSSLNCSSNCLHLGSYLSSAWCVNDSAVSGFSQTEINSACKNSYSRCGDGKVDPNEDDGCDAGGGMHALDCDDYCLKKAQCNKGEQGCSDGKLSGSSLLYLAPSVCGDGVLGAGESSKCDGNPAKLIIKALNTGNPWVLALGQGGGIPQGNPPVQFSNISAVVNNKTGIGKYQVQCGFQTDSECVGKYNDDNKGVANDSCCYNRSKLLSVYPGNTSLPPAANICINTYIEAKFDAVIDQNTLSGNVILAKYDDKAAACAVGTQEVSNSLIANVMNNQNLAWYQKVWYKVVIWMKVIFGGQGAQASVWCSGADIADANVVLTSDNSSKIVLTLTKPLSTSTKYAVVLKPGIKDTKGVHINVLSNGKPFGWQFVTGQNICEVSNIKIDPNQYYFSAANVSAQFTAQASTQNGQLIQPVSGYSWEFAWGPLGSPIVAVSNTTSTVNTIKSQNKNGEVDVHAAANITENKFTKQTGLVGTGRSHIIVFLCENPWPPKPFSANNPTANAIFPYEDKQGNNDNFNLALNAFDNTIIPGSQVVSNGYFNFSTYYCADNGASGSTVDDLPYLKAAVQFNKEVLGATSTAKGVCSDNATKICDADSDCALKQYSIYGNVFTLPVSSPQSICVVDFDLSGTSHGYYFDSTTGQPLNCANNADCTSVKNTSYYTNTQAVGVSCKSIAGSNHVLINNSCTKDVIAYNALKRFIFTNDKNNDAIGIQILPNPKHLTARQWFSLSKNEGGQGFVGNLQDLKIDGYDAVSNGNNIYVNALNYSPSSANIPNNGNLYTNTYLFSINDGASSESKKVFDQLISNLKFNINLTNYGYCGKDINNPSDVTPCVSDFDCSGGEVCAVQKDKMQRFFERLQNMSTIEKGLSTYFTNHNSTYPDLKAGTYLTGQSISTWPSWSLLGNAIGSLFPTDPINKLGPAGTCEVATGVQCLQDIDCANQVPQNQKCILHDPITGWSTDNQRFSFSCAANSLAYRYLATLSTSSAASGASDYSVRLKFEDFGLNILNKVALYNDFIPAASQKHFVLESATGICNADKEISTINTGVCGDGKLNLNKGEQCDPPGSLQYNLQDCNKFGVTSSTPLSVQQCSATCQWQAAAPTTCGKKLSKCGDGVVQIGETCDEGVLNNKYGHCNSSCSGYTSFCGDGKLDSKNEVCDVGISNSGWCVTGINFAKSCLSDNDCKMFGTTQSQQGSCFLLKDSKSKYSLSAGDSCNWDCQKTGPFCGDGAVQKEFGEECDGDQSCSIAGVTGNRFCNAKCRWQNNSAILYYKFDDVYWSDKTYLPNSASTTGSKFSDYKAYCSGNASTGSCPLIVDSVTADKHQALYFNGTSNYLTIDHQPTFDVKQLTISTWINVATSSASDWYAFFSKQDVSSPKQPKRDYDFIFHTNTSGGIDNVGLSSRNWIDNTHQDQIFGDTYVTAPANKVWFSTGEWHFLAVTMDLNHVAKYYLDGGLIGSDQGIGTTTVANGNYAIWIGQGDKDKFFKGMLDEIQFYDRALTADEIKDLYQNSQNFCEAKITVAAEIPPPNCGNSKIEVGEVCDTGVKNGVTCTPSYSKSCTYCSAKCDAVITINQLGFCGDGIVNGPEKCDVDQTDDKIYASATSTGTGAFGLSTWPDKSVGNGSGFWVYPCDLENNTTLNLSSLDWYNQKSFSKLVGKIGAKSCGNSCSSIQDNCVACGLKQGGGVSIAGTAINALDPNSSDPLLADSQDHDGTIDLYYVGKDDKYSGTGFSSVSEDGKQVFRVAYNYYTQGNAFSSFVLHPANPTPNETDPAKNHSNLTALINSSAICSDNQQVRSYRLAINDDRSFDHMLDFPVFGSAPSSTYNLILSPVIELSKRPTDLRVVVSWVGNSQFSSGFLVPTIGKQEGASMPNSTATGIGYYNQNNTAGIWYHQYAYKNTTNVESFTINTSAMTSDYYAFYVRSNSGGINNLKATAKLKVDVYLPDTDASTAAYRHFSRPVKTFYLSQSAASANPDAPYWHAFNIGKTVSGAVSLDNIFSDKGLNSIRTDINLAY